ncbi:uncharacterized protein [Littorina saxatilis]|uniref:uncharacterized protein n=1 Tax=Littorina saxatilis TaxID=31220 RepID=UPI0038B4BB49
MNFVFSPLLLVGAAILLNDCAVDGLGHASMAAQQTQGRVEGKLDPNITELSPAPLDWYGRKKITARRRSEKDQSEVSSTPREVTERRLNKKPTVNTPVEDGTGTPPASKSSPENKQRNNQNDPNNADLAHGAPKVQADTYYNVSLKREGMTLIWTQNQAATATSESVRDGGRLKRSRVSRDTYGPYGRSCQCKNCNIDTTNVQKGNLVNIAVNQPATSSSMYGTQEPCFAVNGRTSGEMRDRGNNYPNCFHSASNDNAFTWWSVDLQSEYTIAEVEVYRRTLDNYRDALSMQGIVITINGMVCYTYPTLNNKAALASIPHQQTVRCVEPLRGRHVMLQKRVGIPTENDYKFIQICEIQIYVFDKSSRLYGDPQNSTGTACPSGCLCDNFYGCSRRVLFNVAYKKKATAVCGGDSQVTVNGFVDYPSYADVQKHCITCSVSATQNRVWAIHLYGVFHIYYLLVKNRHHTLELSPVGRGVNSRIEPSSQFIPCVFNWVQIWGERGPGQSVHVVGGQEVCGVSGGVGSGVSMLELSPWRGQEGQGVWLQNVLHVVLGVQAAWNFHKLAPASVGDGPPHHHAPTTMRRRLIYALLVVALSLPPVHLPPAVVMLQEEIRLIAEDNVAPVVGKGPLEVQKK